MNLTVVLAILAIALAVIPSFYHFGLRGFRFSPVLLLIIVLLIAARYAARRQAHKREELLKKVPRRPLGLSDDSGS